MLLSQLGALTPRKMDFARLRYAISGTLYLLAALGANGVQAFPALNLTPGLPDISSPGQVDVSYTFNAGTGIGTLSAFGGATQLSLPPSQSITGGVFNLSASIDPNAMTATGSLTINGTSGGFGDPLLTSMNLNQFGAGGAGSPLEFIFGNLGGSTALNFAPTAGVILSNTGFTGSLTQNFGTGGSFGASANTFRQPPAGVPEPGTLALMLLGSGAFALTRRKRTLKGN